MPCSTFWITSAVHELLLYRTALNISKSPVHGGYFKLKTDIQPRVSGQPRLWQKLSPPNPGKAPPSPPVTPMRVTDYVYDWRRWGDASY